MSENYQKNNRTPAEKKPGSNQQQNKANPSQQKQNKQNPNQSK